MEGFKNTEVGIIPKDWKIKNIEDLCVPNGVVRGPFGGTLKKECFVPSGYKIYEQRNAIYSDVNIGNYYINAEKFNELKRFEIKERDFIVSCSGTIGCITQIPRKFKKGIINQALLKLTIDHYNYSEGYFLQYFRWNNFQKVIIDNTQGGAMKNLIGMSDFKKTLIPIPPTLAEQTAIATALNDTDTLIQKLEQLLAKKRAIKIGAMQELLRPKKGWVVKKLGEVVNFSNGQAHEKFIDDNGKYIVVNSKFISTEGKIIKYSNQNIAPLLKGDIAIVMSDIPNGKALAKCFIVEKDNKYTLNQRIGSINPKEGNSKYYYYQLNRNKYFLSFDSGSGQTNLRKNDILGCPFPLPKSIEEQNYIAQILSDMDAEIQELEKKIEKYKEIKQGMMQVLLTGKIRLV